MSTASAKAFILANTNAKQLKRLAKTKLSNSSELRVFEVNGDPDEVEYVVEDSAGNFMLVTSSHSIDTLSFKWSASFANELKVTTDQEKATFSLINKIYDEFELAIAIEAYQRVQSFTGVVADVKKLLNPKNCNIEKDAYFNKTSISIEPKNICDTLADCCFRIESMVDSSNNSLYNFIFEVVTD